jgi:hypothetical protein
MFEEETAKVERMKMFFRLKLNKLQQSIYNHMLN